MRQSLLTNTASDRLLEGLLTSSVIHRCSDICLEVIKGAIYLGVTTTGRLPWFNLCLQLFPSLPGVGATLGVAYGISWGSVILHSCYELEAGARVRTKLLDLDPEAKGSACAEGAKVVTAVVWSLAAEAPFFALAYLANNKSVPMLGCSIINAAIPAYSIYLSIHATARQRRLTPTQLTLKAAQETFIAKLDQVIRYLPINSERSTLARHINEALNKELDSATRLQAFQRLFYWIDGQSLAPPISHPVLDNTGRVLAACFAASYLAWAGYLAYLGGMEIESNLVGLWSTFAVIAVIANAHFIWSQLLHTCTAIPRSVHDLCTGRRIAPFSERLYPITTVTLKVSALVAALLSFGPSGVVSMQNLPHGWNIVSAFFLSGSLALVPIMPMMNGIDRAVTLMGEKMSASKEDCKLYNRLVRLRFALSCATESSFASLQALLDREDRA